MSKRKCDKCGSTRSDLRVLPKYTFTPFGPKGVLVTVSNMASERVCLDCGEVLGLRPGWTPAMMDRLVQIMVSQTDRLMTPREIHSVRKWLGLTQAELGRLLGVKNEQVSRWETGSNPISEQGQSYLQIAVRYHKPDQGQDIRDLLAEQDLDQLAELDGRMLRVDPDASGAFEISAAG